MLTAAQTGDYSNGVLSPGERVDMEFVVCLRATRPFAFYVDVLGREEFRTEQRILFGAFVQKMLEYLF